MQARSVLQDFGLYILLYKKQTQVIIGKNELFYPFQAQQN